MLVRSNRKTFSSYSIPPAKMMEGTGGRWRRVLKVSPRRDPTKKWQSKTTSREKPGKTRIQVEPIAERLKGKGSIKDFLILLWIHSVMDLKCQSFLSRCESFIPLVMKELTETPPNYFTYSALSSKEINPQLEEIVNFLTKVTKWHALLCLTYLGDIQRFNQVLGKGFLKNKFDGIYNKLTLLNSTILFYKKEMVQHLLEKKKANARIRDKAGRNALNMAALFTDEEEIIKLILSVKIKVDACDRSGMTALHYAVISSNLTVARHLIDHGADFKRLDPTGHSPLHLAAHYAKDSQILELLLTKVEIDECDLDGITALHSAAIASNAVSARYLLERGADINRPDKSDRTPVHVAAAFAKNVDFFKIFLTNEKADLECCDERKLTVLAYANINQHGSAKEIVSGIEKKNNDKHCEYSLAGLAKLMSGLQYFGGEYEQKLIFVPDADNEPYVDHEISEAALFRFLLNKETLQQLDEAEIPDMLKVLKDVDKESKISEFETHQSNMGLRTDFKGAFHVFIVFRTTSGKDRDYWWSLEKGMDYIFLQRSRNKENVKDNLYGETRTKVKPIVENLKGKGTIKDLFAILWAQQAIPEKYHIFQSFVTFVSKQITEIGYEFKGYFPYSPRKSGRDKQMLDLINVIRGCSDCPPLFTLIGMGNIDLIDKIVARGKYDINAVHDGRTLLHFAIMLSKTKIVEHLLKHPLNADPTSRDPCGRTALLAAASSTMKSEIFDLLLTHPKVMIDDADENGRTALHWAAVYPTSLLFKNY
jgi:ankyrin repeat protein